MDLSPRGQGVAWRRRREPRGASHTQHVSLLRHSRLWLHMPAYIRLALLTLPLVLPSTVSAQERCSIRVPPEAREPVSFPPTRLAGDYLLTMIPWQPSGSTTISGRLHLEEVDPRDTSRFAAGPRDQLLIGWFDLPGADTAWRRIVGSRDPSNPGVRLRGQGLRIGQQGGTDAIGDNLRITAVSPRAFWGFWTEDPGLGLTIGPDSTWLPSGAGFFCAFRVPRKR